MLPIIDNYQSLCTLFYDLDKPFPPAEEYAFYYSYLRKYKTHILEPFCGSGRFLIPFLKEGFLIHAFDASPSMLLSLKKRLEEERLLCQYEFALFQNYIFNQKYNLIYIPSASLSLLWAREVFLKAVSKIYEHLEKGGAFVFEVETPSILEKDRSDFTLIANHFLSIDMHQKILGSFINDTYQDGVLTISCRYDLIVDDIIRQTEFENIVVRLFLYEEIVSLLEGVGFVVTVYSDFQKTVYRSSIKLPKLLIIEAIK